MQKRASLSMHMLITWDNICPTVGFHAYYLMELSSLADQGNHIGQEMLNARIDSSPSGVVVNNKQTGQKQNHCELSGSIEKIVYCVHVHLF